MEITGTGTYQSEPDNTNRVYKNSQSRAAGSFDDYQEFHKARMGQSNITCTAQGSHKVMLCRDALMSYASPQTGESVNIYRADNYSKENPMYVIKGLDAEGNGFENEVDAGKIDPTHCSYNELMVLNVETGRTSAGDYLHSVAVRDQSGAGSYFEKKDYIAYMQAVMKDYQKMGNWDSYLSMDKWLQSIMDYVSKNKLSFFFCHNLP